MGVHELLPNLLIQGTNCKVSIIGLVKGGTRSLNYSSYKVWLLDLLAWSFLVGMGE